MVWLRDEQQSRLICALLGLGAAGSLEGEPQEIRPAELLTGRWAGCRFPASTFPAASPPAAHQAQERWGKQLPRAGAKGRGPSHNPRRGRQLTKNQRERWRCCRLQGVAPSLREPGKHWQEWGEERGASGTEPGLGAQQAEVQMLTPDLSPGPHLQTSAL